MKEYFEANFLDGDKLQKGQLVSAVDVFEYIQEVAQKKYQEGELNGFKASTDSWHGNLGLSDKEILEAFRSQLERKEQ